jgi:hypothetical protein
MPDDYPETTATDSSGWKDGQSFPLVLKEPVSAVTIHVVGKSSFGDRRTPKAFAACVERHRANGFVGQCASAIQPGVISKP